MNTIKVSTGLMAIVAFSILGTSCSPIDRLEALSSATEQSAIRAENAATFAALSAAAANTSRNETQAAATVAIILVGALALFVFGRSIAELVKARRTRTETSTTTKTTKVTPSGVAPKKEDAPIDAVGPVEPWALETELTVETETTSSEAQVEPQAKRDEAA